VFTSVAVGAYHACGLREDGHIQCWGDNFYGKQTEAPSGEFSQISAGLTHTCALRTNGTITCWGIGSSSLVVPDGEFTQVTAGGIDACGLRANGHVECWSYGDWITIDVPAGTFESITSSGHGLTQAGYRHLGCGIRPNKTIECWGNAEYGLLDPPEGEFTSVSAGGEQACAVRTDGEVVCWGHGYSVDPLSIFDVPPGPFVEVECGYHHTCGLRPDGTISCWGLDQLESICGDPPTCGNGLLEPGEVCEPAAGGFVPGDPCNARCFVTPCGQPVNAEAIAPRISDALFVLQTSVQLKSCGNYVCDVNTDKAVDVADALLIMQKAVSLPVTLRCARSIAVGGILKKWEPCPYSPIWCQLL
jgi:cysteine-rich repeat protein